MPKRGIAGTELKKTVLELKISNFEYPFIPSFILNKAL